MFYVIRNATHKVYRARTYQACLDNMNHARALYGRVWIERES